ncbi:MAG TPA: alpha/beta fold hydrolase [Gammaproteobacteria bacterium]|nr:alpha/beta fold hydrolase [Gammaproteobacteria bacterium]
MNLIWLLIKTAFCLLIIIAFLYNFFTHFILWMELRLLTIGPNNVHAKIGMRYSWLNLIKSFFIEFCCILVNILLYPIRFISKKQKQISSLHSSSAIPILFVHGYLHNQMAWFWFIRHLQKKPAIGALYTINLFPFFASSRELAEQLKEKINHIQRETGSYQVILIGHSMGGIICSYFCEYLAKFRQVAMVITLGSPFKGTRVAAFGFGKNAKEMCPASLFLTELRARIKLSRVPYYSIASKIDNVIIPWQSALSSDESETKTQLIVEDHGHLRLLISPLIIQQVADWISINKNTNNHIHNITFDGGR